MSDIAGQESTTEYTEPIESASETQVTEDHSQEQTEANPFWGEVEKLTGPNVYKLIQPHLNKADQAAQQRITQVNQSYAPWKALADQDITPDQVLQALTVVQRLNDPEGQVQVFESLQNFLREQGRLPTDQELEEQIEDDTEGAEEDPRLAALAQQNQAIIEFLQSQQAAEAKQIADREADSWIESEVSRLTSAHGYSKDDVQEIIRIAAFQAQQTGKDPENLDAAAAHFNALRDRIRTAPRPGQLAPRIPAGPGGGSPEGTVDPSKMDKASRQELVAAMLQRGKQ